MWVLNWVLDMNTRSKVFASYNIPQYQCDFIHVLIFVIVSKCQKNPKLTNIVIKVLVALVFFMAIRHVMVVVVILQQLALHQHYGAEKKDCRAKCVYFGTIIHVHCLTLLFIPTTNL